MVMLCAVALLLFGVVMVTSAGMSIGRMSPAATASAAAGSAADPAASAVTDPDSFLGILTSRNAQYFVIAVVGMFAVSRLPVRRWLSWVEDRCPARDAFGYMGLGVGTLALLAVVATVYIPGLGQERNGSHRWITPGLPGVETVQPSEIAKWLCPLLVAWFVAGGLRPTIGTRGELIPARSSRLLPGVLPGVMAAGAVSGLIVLEDLGTGVLVASASGVILLAGGMKLWHAGLFVPPALGAIAAAVIDSPYRAQRVLTFLDPFANPQGDGYHMVQSLATVAGGGLFGRGLGHGVQKFGYLPQDTTDFLFAVVCEELGLAGAVAIISLLGMMVLMLVGIARREPSALAKLFVLGVGATIAIQATINLAVVLGLAPTKGIALPLVSAGGTGWILTALSLGVAASLDRTAPGTAMLEDDARFLNDPDADTASLFDIDRNADHNTDTDTDADFSPGAAVPA